MPKTDRPVIILFFYRFMEFRLFFQTNMINLLQEDANVVVVVAYFQFQLFHAHR